MSMVKMAELELKMDVNEDMRAAIITANMRPLFKEETVDHELLYVIHSTLIDGFLPRARWH